MLYIQGHTYILANTITRVQENIERFEGILHHLACHNGGGYIEWTIMASRHGTESSQ